MWLIKVSVVLVYLFLISLVAGEFEFLQKTNAESNVKSANDIKYNYEQFKKIDNDINKTNDSSSKEENLQRKKRGTLDKPKKDQISLVIIFDNTGSMRDDLVQLREGAKEVIKVITNAPNNPVYDYVFVQFSDPSIGPILQTTDQIELMNALDEVKLIGNEDCPEMALTGLLKGLELALPKSKAFVFTDDIAKDFDLKDDVMKITQNKEITVSFLLTNIPGGKCGLKSGSDYKDFEDIAQQSSGQVYDLGKKSVKEIVSAIPLILNRDTTPIEINYGGPGNTTSKVHVDSTMKNMTVSLTGKELNINLTDPSKKEYKNYTEVIRLDTIIMIKVDGPEPGIWEIRTYSTSNQSIIVRGFTNLRINYGFSFLDPETFEDTVRNPIENVGNVLSLFVEKNENLHNLTMVELELANPKENESAITYHLRKLDPSECDQVACLYVTAPFEPPHSSFKIRVRGFDSSGNPLKYFVSIDIKAIDGELLKPKVTIDLSKIEVEEGEKISIVCKVTSNQPPKVNWIIQDRLVRPDKEKRIFLNENSTFYYTINEASVKDTGKYRCTAKNAYGADSGDVNVFVQRIPLEVKMVKTKMVAKENDANFEIKCSITPIKRKVKVNWQQNGKEVIDSEELQVAGSKLTIKRVSRTQTGNYTCKAEYMEQTGQSTGHLDVKYGPEITGLLEEDKMVNFGEKVNLSCIAKGFPQPKIIWNREDGTEIKNIIDRFTPGDHMPYICSATNGVGPTQKKIIHLEGRAAERPRLVPIQLKHVLKFGGNLTLKGVCKQCGPITNFSWKYSPRNDSWKDAKTLIGTGPFREMDSKNFEYNLELKNVTLDNTGYYSIRVANEHGLTSFTAQVEIDVPIPKIEIIPTLLDIEEGQNVSFACKVDSAVPPTINWNFKNKIIKSSGNRKVSQIYNGATLELIKADLADPGEYTCSVQSLNKEYKKTVNLKVRPFPLQVKMIESNMVTTENKKNYEISCTISPSEKTVSVKWFFNSNKILNDHNVKVTGSKLTINRVSRNQTGNYTCEAEYVGQTGQSTGHLIVKYGPEITGLLEEDKMVNFGEKVNLSCIAKGFPQPKVIWNREDGTEIKNIIDRFTPGDHGSYICSAINGVGPTQKRIIHLEGRAAERPRLVPIHLKHVLKFGGNLTLKGVCKQCGPITNFSWKYSPRNDSWKDAKTLIGTGPFREMDSKNFEYNLELKNVTIDNTGYYSIRVANEHGSTSFTAQVEIDVPIPKIEIIPTLLDIEEGQNVSFACKVDSAVPPTINWNFKNKIMKSSGNRKVSQIYNGATLELIKADLADPGEYTCSVQSINKEYKKTVNLKVRPFPLQVKMIESNMVTTENKKNYEISCTISPSEKTVSVKWFFNSNKILNDHNVKVNGSKLTINRVSRNQTGNYTCEAEYVGQTGQSTGHLIVKYGPEITGLLEEYKMVNFGEKVNLSCIAKGFPQPKVIWNREDGTEIKNIIDRFTPGDDGSYICSAINGVGPTQKRIIHLEGRAAERPRLVPIHLKHVLKFGGNLSLKGVCKQCGPITNFSWKYSPRNDSWKDAKTLIGTGPFREMDSKNFEYNLELKNVTLDNTGYYSIRVANEHGSTSFTAQVEIDVPIPKIEIIPTLLDIEEGQNVSFACKVDSAVPPTINWNFKNKIIKSSGNRKVSQIYNSATLELIKANLTDSGEYTCSVQSLNKEYEKTVNLKVRPLPLQVKMIESNMVTTENKKNYEISCTISPSEKTVSVKWFFNSNKILNDHNVKVNGSKLTINRVSRNQTGNYTCEAEYVGQTGQSTGHLIVKYGPEITGLLEEYKMVNFGEKVNLSCIAKGFPQPKVIWYREDGTEIKNIIDRFTPGDHGSYICSAINGVGPTQKRIIHLEGRAAERPRLVPIHLKHVLKFGGNLTLKGVCKQCGPITNFSWKYSPRNDSWKDAKTLIGTGPFREMDSKNFEYNLELKNVTLDDTGYYNIRVANEHGSTSFTAQVDIDVPIPKIKIIPTLLDIEEGQNVSFACKVDSAVPPTINWNFKNKIMKSSGNRKVSQIYNGATLELIKANLTDSGEYTCSVQSLNKEYEKTVNLKVRPFPLQVKMIESNMVTTENKKNYEISCTISPSPSERTVSVKWFFNGNKIPHYHNVKVLGSKLLFKRVNRKHSGVYTCIGTDGIETKKSDGHLNVLYPAEILGSLKENHTIIFDSKVTLNCTAIGNPKPKLVWSHENQTEVGDIIEKFTPENYGMYICEATNEVGEPSRKYVYLNSTTNGPPNLIHSEYYQRLKLNESITLKCGCIQCGPIYHFVWKHLVHPDSPKKPTILNGIGPIQDDRTKNFQYDLELNNVKASDDGYYICEIGNKYKIESAVNHVNVLEAPSIAELVPFEVKKSSDGFAKVNQGADVTLLCKAKGSPTPEVLWTKDKLQIVSKENSIANALILRNFNANDIGKYRCVARNSLGRVYKELQLYLTHPFLPINTIMTANEEQFVTIPCENQKLTFNNVQLNISDSRFRIVGKDLIFKAYYNDSGVYKCKTEDGSDTAETTLIVSAAPSVFPKDDDSKYIRSGEWVTLRCRAEGFPFPKIIWTFSGIKINKGPNTRPIKGGNLQLKYVTANMTGNYVCHASNKFGEVLRTTFVTVASAPNIITNFKSELTATRFERNFPQSCEATGEPKPEVFWEFQGERYAAAVSQHILDVTFKMFPGEYTCVAKNSEGEVRKTVRISSLGPPKRSDPYVKRKVHVAEGQEFLFHCPFSNARTVVWIKNGMRLDTEPIAPLEVFSDPNASLKHSGNYTCIAGNEAGYRNYTHELTVLPSNDLEKLRVGRRRFNEVTRKADETVALSCSTERRDIPRAINWIYNNQIISKNRILVLENIQLHDAGRYDCKDVEDFGYIYGSYILTVLSPPKANMSKENWNVLKENETLELECLIFGNPTPKISWAKDNNPLSESTTTVLLIPFIKLNGKGIYKCVGENKYGRAEIIYHIDILEKPKLDFVTSNIIFDDTHDIQLRCDAHGNPRPLLVWSLKGEMLMGTSQIPAFATGSQNLDEFGSPSEIVPESSKNRFYGKGFVEGNKISLMLVMTGKDYKLPGTYTCHAINSIGKEEKDVKVVVISNEPPYLEGNDINKKAHNELNVLAGMPIVLSCPWIGKPKPNILWFKDNIQQNFKISASHDKRVLTLTNSTASDSGLYTCRANNKVGSKEKDFKVNVFAPSYFSLLKTESATESNALVLNCPIAESESYIVYWEEELHLGKPKSILPEKLTKLIPNHGENSAIYSCYTRSSAGVSEKKIEVQLIKSAPMQHHDTYKSINEGHTITLHCPIILDDPMPYIAWFHNGHQIFEIPSKISISENRMTLNVFNARKNDAGIYGCQTKGSAVKVESDITVKVRRRTEWSPWTPWSLCNKSCDKGTRIRTRQCVLLNGKPAEKNDPPCDGEQFESQICNPFPCPIAGRWGEWKNWSPCSHSCWSSTKKSFKSRYRECNSPPPSAGGVLCIGSNIEKVECNVPHCPIDGGWSSYGDWSSCSVTCGNGVRSRHRRCDNPRPLYRGRNCSGERSETKACSTKPCPIDGGWSDWSKWSTCSRCMQQHIRTCNNPRPSYGGKSCVGRNYQRNSCCI